MLILQRKTNQSLLIDGKIEVTIAEINGDKVKLAIKAPKEIAIVRSELIQTANANKEAAKNANDAAFSQIKEFFHLKDEK